MAIEDFCFKQFTIIQDLENNNWIIVDPLGIFMRHMLIRL